MLDEIGFGLGDDVGRRIAELLVEDLEGVCKSTGREPMAQPPGNDTRAVPKRANKGPSTKIEARMVFTIS